MSIPLIGFGTWQLEGADAYNGVRAALEIGYRHIDTATGYGNEEQVGAAIRDSGIDRENVFITTKCPPEKRRPRAGNHRRQPEGAGHRLRRPVARALAAAGEARPETWKVFIEALEQGKTRAIGVSNYSIAQIDELTAATGKTPSLNQIPWSPFAYDKDQAAELGRPPRRPGGLQPAEAQRPEQPGAGRHRGRARQDARPGHLALAC